MTFYASTVPSYEDDNVDEETDGLVTMGSRILYAIYYYINLSYVVLRVCCIASYCATTIVLYCNILYIVPIVDIVNLIIYCNSGYCKLGQQYYAIYWLRPLIHTYLRYIVAACRLVLCTYDSPAFAIELPERSAQTSLQLLLAEGVDE
jgi:hypothetical protein